MAKNDSSEGEHKELLLKSEEKRHPGIGVPLATTILVGELAGSGQQNVKLDQCVQYCF